jgi:hypothetical protein
MGVERSVNKRVSAVAAALLTGTLALTSAPADALAGVARFSTQRLGPVTGLNVEVSKPGDAYRLDATWNTLARAASYRVTLTNKATGDLVDEARVSDGVWHTSTALPALTRLRLRVVPFTATNRRGAAAFTSFRLPDLTAPTGSYRVSTADKQGTVTQQSLSDDVTAAADVVREINWGTGFEPWTTGDSISATFEAGNAQSYVLTLVIGDRTAPVGQFVVSPASGWARLTRVRVDQTALSDDFSAAADIQRWVLWGDGTGPTRWQTGTRLGHVYRVGGTFAPVVRLVDQAGNSVDVETSPVLIKVDRVAPSVSVKVPQRRVRYVDSWRTVRGRATDVDGSGVRRVRLRIVEKRGELWYAYRAPSRTWVKAATKAAAFRKTRAARVAPTARSTWSYRITSLRKGRLVLRVTARDRVGNVSRPVVVRQTLTR